MLSYAFRSTRCCCPFSSASLLPYRRAAFMVSSGILVLHVNHLQEMEEVKQTGQVERRRGRRSTEITYLGT